MPAMIALARMYRASIKSANDAFDRAGRRALSLPRWRGTDHSVAHSPEVTPAHR